MVKYIENSIIIRSEKAKIGYTAAMGIDRMKNTPNNYVNNPG